MTQITGKTVYVLGAGASRHTGAPLLSDFLVTARRLMEGNIRLQYTNSFQKVFEWVNGLRASSYYVEFDLDNLEHVFSLGEMSRQLNLSSGNGVSLDLRRVIMETLDHCSLRWQKNQIRPDGLYFNFVKFLFEINNNRIEDRGDTNTTMNADVIITFNYDVMLDYAMSFQSLIPEYCLGPPPYHGQKYRLLKLHGSTNWATCECTQDPKEYLQVIPASPIPEGHVSPGSPKDGDRVHFKMVTNVLSSAVCKYCQQRGKLTPFMIPPTWSKIVENTALAHVWASAAEAISSAHQIIVIGYSMPQTDTFFQYLLTLGLKNNSRLHRIVIVNSDDSEEFKDRYRKVFSRSLHDRGRLNFISDTSFYNFVFGENEKGMKTLGGRFE